MLSWKELHTTYERELLEQVIPFWGKNCIDRECGGYFTCLDRDGAVFDTVKDMWMQWRIVYMFAVLSASEYSRPGWLEIAVSGYEFLTRYGKNPDGNYYRRLNRQGEPIMPPDFVCESYAAMGIAALYRATGEQCYREEAENCIARFIDGMNTPRTVLLPALRQRIAHVSRMMMLCLGGLAVECFDEDLYAAETLSAVDQVLSRFYHPRHQVILEQINQDGTYFFDIPEGRRVLSGHNFESLWFILHYAELTGRRELIAPACNALKGVLNFCLDREYGGICSVLDVLGLPLPDANGFDKSWWVHNEAVLATLYAYRLTGDRDFAVAFNSINTWAWEHFRDPEHGEWFLNLNRAGKPWDYAKGSRNKSMLHLPRCLLTGMKLFREIMVMENADGVKNRN